MTAYQEVQAIVDKECFDHVKMVLKRCKCNDMPPIAKAMEMRMDFPPHISRKRLRHRVRQFEKTWDPYPEFKI